MAVSPYPSDNDGKLLATNVTALSAKITATTSTAVKASLSAALDQAQRELVYHYLDVGRLTAANILTAAL